MESAAMPASFATAFTARHHRGVGEGWQGEPDLRSGRPRCASKVARREVSTSLYGVRDEEAGTCGQRRRDKGNACKFLRRASAAL
jgi:hypothetical protein